jgi:CRISPR-associated protein Cmr2
MENKKMSEFLNYITDKNYWDNKLIAYWHDPIDKALNIKNHEVRAAEYLSIYGLEKPNKNYWNVADSIASGFQRGVFPSYNSDKDKNGAIDFLKNPILTHPISNEKLETKIPLSFNINKFEEDVKDKIKEIIGMKPEDGGYSTKFSNDSNGFSVARFFHTHFILRYLLSSKNTLELGSLWHKIPADTRIPDHSIWDHNSLVSAINSCIELSHLKVLEQSEKKEENKNYEFNKRNLQFEVGQNVGLMTFSISPVQEFISVARKLRDYWTGSVIISWLAFEGIKWVMENLGPDHVIFPSLIDQPLVNKYLLDKWRITESKTLLSEERKLATLPNKFMFLIPIKHADEIGKQVEESIQKNWKNLYENLLHKLKFTLKLDSKEVGTLERIFENQNKNYWKINWSASNLLSEKNIDEIKNLLPRNRIENILKISKHFSKMINTSNESYGLFYPLSHSLTQSVLASSKNIKNKFNNEELGEKCHLCGELEVLNICKDKRDIKDYKKSIENFWDKVISNYENSEFKENERLCSICLMKRLAYRIIKDDKNHILNETFDTSDYPSTTYLALSDYFNRENITNENTKKQVAQDLYDSEKKIPGVVDKDKYYSILMMDGDKMGDLINGDLLENKWENILHPEIVSRFKKDSFEKKYRDNWKELLKERRTVTPSFHLAVSEALGDFSLYGVSSIVRKNRGKLIYAGGDDVCAVLPISSVLKAATEIKDYYNSNFRIINKNGSVFNSKELKIKSKWSPQLGKLSIGMGDKGASISAAILVCHHKENLSEMIKRANNLLKSKAKEECGRDACAIELKKRSGGSRFFENKWNDYESWNSFKEIGKFLYDDKLSTSLVYKISKFKDGVESTLEDKDFSKKFLETLIFDFKKNNNETSKEIKTQKDELANHIYNIIKKGSKKEVNLESLIVASFFNKNIKENKEA